MLAGSHGGNGKRALFWNVVIVTIVLEAFSIKIVPARYSVGPETLYVHRVYGKGMYHYVKW